MRYLICAMGSYGYLLPALHQGRQLIDGGHDVAVVSARRFRAEVERRGFRYIPSDGDSDSFDVRYWGDVAEILREIQHTLYACRCFRPDVLLTTQLALGPLAVGRAQGIPTVQIGFATYLWPKRDIPAAEQTPLDRERAGMHAMAVEALETAAARVFGPRFARPLIGDEQYRHSPLIGDAHLLRSIPELEPEQALLSPRVHFAGSCLPPVDPDVDPDLARVIDRAAGEGRALLFVQYVSGGGIPDYWPNLMEVVKRERVHVVAATGRFPLDNATLPDNVYVRPHVDHQHILPHATLVITAGTTSTMLGALTHGLPLLLLPFTSENPEVALRCERAGAALTLSPFDRYTGTPRPENITPEKLRAAMRQLLAPESSQRRAARRLQQLFADLDARNPAAQILHDVSRRPMPVPA